MEKQSISQYIDTSEEEFLTATASCEGRCD